MIAHELAHIKNKDMLIQTVAAGIGSMISVLPWLAGSVMRRSDDEGGGIGDIAFMILAPFVAMMLQFAISRQREFAADRTGAEIVGKARAAGAGVDPDGRDGASRSPLPVSPSLARAGDRQPAQGGRPGQALQHAPADRGAGRGVARL